ncbi:NAD(P)H-binding protein [Flavihumibacter petaseus]|uniref:NAD(P)-binding domain-containing protein n=1 Tax=Flavihumibacter petaseus NBRC 106054 TaxID=1220578 RepID=A0A0E9N137_9BACT|nr:NAD(P)H-binding protein [Flavihumibacter petaseus]GAO43742.1 hypothetical protein FPE01S_02_08480 [Flavihumibacter petaseus NBRC 106054]
MGRKATILGASGLIGGLLLDALLEDDYYDSVHVILRRSLNQQHPKLTEHLIDFSNQKAYEPGIASAETVFCCVGTTMKKVQGDRNAYRDIDYGIAVNAAEVAAKYGVFGYSLVSAIGADPANNNSFYLKLKGVTEEAVSKQNIPQVHIFRPSLLLGDRGEKRFAENLATGLAPVISPLLRGRYKKYRPIKAIEVAFAMLAAAKDPRKGIFIHEYDEIREWAIRSGRYQA